MLLPHLVVFLSLGSLPHLFGGNSILMGASLIDNPGNAGTAGLLRDSHGKWIAGFTSSIVLTTLIWWLRFVLFDQALISRSGSIALF